MVGVASGGKGSEKGGLWSDNNSNNSNSGEHGLERDPCVPLLTRSSEEAQKVERNGGETF